MFDIVFTGVWAAPNTGAVRGMSGDESMVSPDDPKNDITFVRIFELDVGWLTKLKFVGIGDELTAKLLAVGLLVDVKYCTAAAIPRGTRTFCRIPPPAAVEPEAEEWNSGNAGVDPAKLSESHGRVPQPAGAAAGSAFVT